MRLLRSQRDVRPATAGASCRRSTGWRAAGPAGTRDWFFFVNGIEADVGAAEYELSPGDVVQWDYRDWRGDDATCRRSSARTPSRS